MEGLKENMDKPQSQNLMLSCQIKNVSKMGGVDRYDVMQLRKMVKEDLFKRVKCMTTEATEFFLTILLTNSMHCQKHSMRTTGAVPMHTVFAMH